MLENSNLTLYLYIPTQKTSFKDGTDIWRKNLITSATSSKCPFCQGDKLARAVGIKEVGVVSHLRKRMDILLVKDDIAMLHARTQNVPNPHVDGDMDVDITRSSTIIIYKFGRTVFIPIKSLNSKHINGHKQT